MDGDKVAMAIEDTYNEMQIALQYSIRGVEEMQMYQHEKYREGVIDGLHMAYGIVEQMKEFALQ